MVNKGIVLYKFQSFSHKIAFKELKNENTQVYLLNAR